MRVHNDCHEMKSKRTDLLQGENHSEAWLWDNTNPYSLPKQIFGDNWREKEGEEEGLAGCDCFSAKPALLSQPNLLTPPS